MPHTATTPPKLRPLSPKQARFVELYLVSLNATRAYKEAYKCSDRVANQNGPILRVNTGISAAIESAMQERTSRTEITQDMVVHRLWAIATADPRELMEYRRTCCRHCWGLNFDYQYTQREIDRHESSSQRMWEQKKRKKKDEEYEPFNTAGGAGYDRRKAPHPDCPECFGEGTENVFIHDTKKLSSSGVMLLAAIKRTKDGLEVKTHDQHAALVKVGEHIGMFKGANINVNVDLDALTDPQLEHIAKGGSLATLPK